MDPNRVIFFGLIVLLGFTSCFTATLNPKNVNLNSQDPLKSSTEKATTSKPGIDKGTTSAFKLETPRYVAEASSKLNDGLKSEPSTGSPPKNLRFQIPLKAEAKLETEKKSENLGVTSADVDERIIKRIEPKPTSSAPVLFDPFHLIQAEQYMMMKKLSQIPLIPKSKEDTIKPVGATYPTQDSVSTVKVSNEKVSETSFGFLSLYETAPKKKASTVETPGKLSSEANYFGIPGNSSLIFTSSLSMLSQLPKLHVPEDFKVDAATSKSTDNLQSVVKSTISQTLPEGQKDTPSEKLQVRSGIVEESKVISRNPTKLPLAELATNGIQLKLTPSEKKNKDSTTLGEKKTEVSPLPTVMEVRGKGLENTIVFPKTDVRGAKFRIKFQPKTNRPSLSTETMTTAAFGGKETKSVESITSGKNTGKKTEGTTRNYQDGLVKSFTSAPLTDIVSKPSLKGELETKRDITPPSVQISKIKAEDVTKSIPVVSVASLPSSPSIDMKYRGNVKVSDMKLNANAKEISKGNAVSEPVQISAAPIIFNPSFINAQLKGSLNRNVENVDVTKPASKGESELKGDSGLQNTENKVEVVTRGNKALPVTSHVSTHFPDVYYISKGNISDGITDRKVKIDGESGSKRLVQTVGSKPEVVTKNVLDVTTGVLLSTRQPSVPLDTTAPRKTKEQVPVDIQKMFNSRRTSGSGIEEVTKSVPAVSVEPLMSTSFPDIHRNANSGIASKGELKAGGNRFQTEKIASKTGAVTSESPSGSVEPQGVLVLQPKVVKA